ncbi:MULTISPECIES: AI-2E family transporter [unclassified Pseudonocardia]|uniref:AI-2E family transporter n=1 Tax=unclassified Pseudonocardia TaxID=2619320 RepID=UPI00094B6BB3|nr:MULTISPECIES: AI-2E family transporter [unclassified Pseudonocardia]OLM18810.1 putative integral membrane protein [Pseudonocardia sp. Ae707_Ps1]
MKSRSQPAVQEDGRAAPQRDPAGGSVLSPVPVATVASRGTVIGNGLTWLAAWSLRVALIAVGLVIAGWVIGTFWVVVWPVVLAILLTTVLRPPAGWLIRHRVPPALASIVVLLVGIGAVSGLFVAIAPSVAGQTQQITTGVIQAVGQIQQWVSGPPLNLGDGQIGDIINQVTAQLQQSITAIAGGVLTGVSTVASGLLALVLALVLTFFFVKDGPRFLPWISAISGRTAGRHLTEVLSRMWSVLGGFIRVQALVSLIDAVFIGIGLVLLSVPLALPLAILTFLGGFIPIVGAFVAGALAVLIALVTQGFTTAVLVLVLILVVQQVEGNVLQPFLQGQSLKLHGAVVLLAVTAGSSLAGIAGAFLAVPVAAVVAVLLRYLGEQIDIRDQRFSEEHPDEIEDGAGDTTAEVPAPAESGADDTTGRNGATTVAATTAGTADPGDAAGTGGTAPAPPDSARQDGR